MQLKNSMRLPTGTENEAGLLHTTIWSLLISRLRPSSLIRNVSLASTIVTVAAVSRGFHTRLFSGMTMIKL